MKLTTKTVTKTVTVVEIQFSDLVVFLEERNALEGYLQGFENSDRESGLCKFLKEQSPRSWIKAAFVWSSTREGHPYWRGLDTEWNLHLNSLEKKYPATVPDPEEEN